MPPNGAENQIRAIHNLQRTIGNRATGRLLQRLTSTIQPKLTVGEAGDAYEREADAAAERVVAGRPVERLSRLPAGGLNRQTVTEEEKAAQTQHAGEEEELRTAALQRQATSEEEEPAVQAKGERKEPELDTATAARAMARSGSGQPLNGEMLARMEGSFGADFSGVRVHTGPAAQEANQAINARAFTRGADIYLGRGESDTNTRLMAHELTHTVQQDRAGINRYPTVQRQDEAPTEITFTEGSEVHQLTRDEADEEVRDLHDNFAAELTTFHEHWKTGLETFVTNMQFASSQEAEANYLGAMGKAAAKSLLDFAIDSTGAIPVIGSVVKPLLKATTDIGMAAFDETARAEQARGEREIAQYINGLNRSVQASKTEMGRGHRDRFNQVLNSYREAARSSPEAETQRGESAWVYDDAARWIRRYREAYRAFQARIPPPRRFQQNITENFALTGQMVGTVTGGTFRPSGTLSLNVEVKRERSGEEWQWSVTDIDDHWTLGTSAPRPERVAQNLMDSLGGYPIMTHCHLPKRINLTIETEVPGFNEETEGTLHILRDRTLYGETRSGEPNLIRTAAANPTIALRILDINTIEGSSR